MLLYGTSVLLTQGREDLNVKDPRWQSPEGQEMILKGYETKGDETRLRTRQVPGRRCPWRSPDVSGQVPDRNMGPRPVLTARYDDEDAEEVKCRITLQGFKDPGVLDLVAAGAEIVMAECRGHFL